MHTNPQSTDSTFFQNCVFTESCTEGIAQSDEKHWRLNLISHFSTFFRHLLPQFPCPNEKVLKLDSAGRALKSHFRAGEAQRLTLETVERLPKARWSRSAFGWKAIDQKDRSTDSRRSLPRILAGLTRMPSAIRSLSDFKLPLESTEGRTSIASTLLSRLSPTSSSMESSPDRLNCDIYERQRAPLRVFFVRAVVHSLRMHRDRLVSRVIWSGRWTRRGLDLAVGELASADDLSCALTTWRVQVEIAGRLESLFVHWESWW